MRVTPATVIAGLALVFTMTSGAYAAKKYLITSTKQISPSVLKQLQGKAGPAGAPGAAGAQGAQGPAGPAGPAGPGGSAGAKGETGPKGEAGLKGERGATGATGAKGATGATGFTETLPSGKTETGVWAASDYGLPEDANVEIPVSFPIPLKEGGVEGWVLNKAQTEKGEGPGHEAGCTGTAEAPTAPRGVLCVYTNRESNSAETILAGKTSTANGGFGYLTAGALILLINDKEESEDGVVKMQGTFAVTAP